jgi:hypothetical protein
LAPGLFDKEKTALVPVLFQRLRLFYIYFSSWSDPDPDPHLKRKFDLDLHESTKYHSTNSLTVYSILQLIEYGNIS